MSFIESLSHKSLIALYKEVLLITNNKNSFKGNLNQELRVYYQTHLELKEKIEAVVQERCSIANIDFKIDKSLRNLCFT